MLAAVLVVGPQHLGHELRCPRRRSGRVDEPGAKAGNFAHDTGEGGISRYHRKGGGDLIWQIGTGYFGCRARTASFDPDLFTKNAADPQVKMIEIKVSQGAKPGHGGILPGAKVTEEIAEARLVEVGKTVFSPTYHQAFSTPLEMMAFITQLRELSGGKPVGFKICIGDPREFMAIVKAMLETDSTRLHRRRRRRGRHGCSAAGVLGLDGRTAHRGTDDRPERPRGRGHEGQDEARSQRQARVGRRHGQGHGARRRLVQLGPRIHVRRRLHPVAALPHEQVPRRGHDPGPQVAAGDRRARQGRRGCTSSTGTPSGALAEMIAAMGLTHPSQLHPDMVVKRVSDSRVMTFGETYPMLSPGQLLDGAAPERFQKWWERASAERFTPVYEVAPRDQVSSPSTSTSVTRPVHLDRRTVRAR